MDGTPRLSRDGEPVYHYSFLSTFADACVVPERSCVPIAEGRAVRRRRARRLRGVDGRRRRLAHRRRAAGRSRRDHRLRRRRAVRAHGRGRGRSRAGHRRRRCAAEARRRARRSARRTASSGREARRRPPRRCARHRAAASTTRSRRPGGPRRWRRRSSRPATRGAAVLIGIPRADAVLSLPATTIPRMERRVLGSIYGSSKPERDFPHTLELYRAGACRSTGSSRTVCRSRRSSEGSS